MEASEPPGWTHETSITIALIGTFVIAWSVFECVVETAIWKELGIGPDQSSILTGTANTQHRVKSLQSLLALKQPNHPAIGTLNVIAGDGFRTKLQHSLYEVAPEMAVIIRTTGPKGRITRIPLSPAMLRAEIEKLTVRTDLLQAQLDVSNTDIHAFANGIKAAG